MWLVTGAHSDESAANDGVAIILAEDRVRELSLEARWRWRLDVNRSDLDFLVRSRIVVAPRDATIAT